MFKYYSKVFILLIAGLTVLSCKKSKVENEVPAPTTNTRSELTKDSIFLYAKEVYLWNNSLPSYEVFKPRSYNSSNLFNDFNDILLKITRYTTNENWYDNNRNLYNEPKYSFIEDLVASGQIAFKSSLQSSVNLNGDGNDTGLNFSYLGTERDYDIVVRYISPNSPAAKQNLIGRGDIISTINGVSYGSNFNDEIDKVLNALEQNTVTITGKKRISGSVFSLTLNKTKYDSSPVLKDSVYIEGSKVIGYLAYARFSDEDNSVAALNNVFQKFASKGVTDLIIDLRYNGGGFVSTAEHLTNLIAPSRLAGKIMFTEYYNAMMQNNQATILKHQPRRDARGNITSGNYYNNGIYNSSDPRLTSLFSKADAGYLNNIERVVFIIERGTASSSELVINSLKPYMNVQLIGAKSYGKPVGFFPIRIDKYDVYYSMFETRNSRNEALYYDGFVPDKLVYNDYDYDFGDKREQNLKQAIYYLVNNAMSTDDVRYSKSSGAGKTAKLNSTVGKNSLDPNGVLSREFKGMIHLPR